MILKTRLTNLLDRARNIKWIDKHGIYLGPGESRIIEGAYPTACRNDACRKEMASELGAKGVSVTLITDLPVEAPKNNEERRIRVSPDSITAPLPQKETVDTGVSENVPEYKPKVQEVKGKEEVFEQISLDEVQMDTVYLDGGEHIAPNPPTQAMFPEGAPKVKTLTDQGWTDAMEVISGFPETVKVEKAATPAPKAAESRPKRTRGKAARKTTAKARKAAAKTSSKKRVRKKVS